MKKFLLAGLMATILAFATQGRANAMGLFYTNATYPVTATGTTTPDLSNLKKGSASTTNVLFCVEVGDASIDEASRLGIPAQQKLSQQYLSTTYEVFILFLSLPKLNPCRSFSRKLHSYKGKRIILRINKG